MNMKTIKPDFRNYQLHPKYSWALSKIDGKGKKIMKFSEIF